ncbi:MAG: hypothetical protein SWX82_18615 [Cyanobacteriota bacterium]|nr:hypothetical protein [Cyanobacteriota bacterium]
MKPTLRAVAKSLAIAYLFVLVILHTIALREYIISCPVEQL